MSFKTFNYWSGFNHNNKTYEPIFNEDIATRNVLFEKTYVPKIIITSTPKGNSFFNMWEPTSAVDTQKIGSKIENEVLYGFPNHWVGTKYEETYWEKQLDLGNVATRVVIFEKYEPHKFQIQSVEVIGGTRAIRATWTPELAQDLAAFQSIDAEAELTAILSAEIAKEIDKEIVNNIIIEVTGWNASPRTVLFEKTIQSTKVLFPKVNRVFS